MKIILVDRSHFSEYYIALLIRRAIKRFLNNINEGRGLISFLLVDYANLLKRELRIKRGEARIILSYNPRDKICKLLTR